MKALVRSAPPCILAAFALLLLGGCEDPEARTRANDAAGALNTLKAEVSKLTSDNDRLSKEVKVLKEELAGKIEARLDKIRDELMTGMKDATEKMIKDGELTRASALKLIEESRAATDRQFAMEKTSVTEEIKKFREEVAKTDEELKKFMDNQLRELYPYAYQPRRTDSAIPAAPEAK
jgi:outer membrane murein-binding lipoprotein Lpp